jgi:hypothetical protein
MSGQQRNNPNRGGRGFRFNGKRKFDVTFARNANDPPDKISKKDIRYRLGSSVDELLEVEDAIETMAKKDFAGEIFQELYSGEPSKYANEDPTRDQIEQRCGAIPAEEEKREYDQYLIKLKNMGSSWAKGYKEYEDKKASFVGTVFADFMNEEIREYLKGRKDYVRNANKPENVSEFYEWIKSSVREKLNLNGHDEIDKIKRMLTVEGELKIRDCNGDAGAYLTKIRKLFKELKELLCAKESIGLPGTLSEIERAARTNEIYTRVTNTLDTDKQILDTVFFEVYKYKLEGTRYKVHYENQMIAKKKGNRAPFGSLTKMLDDLEITINALATEKVDNKRIRSINSGENAMQINSAITKPTGKVDNPCGFCTHKLHYKNVKHDYYNCYFNKKNIKYKGDVAREKAIKDAGAKKAKVEEAKDNELKVKINTAVADQLKDMKSKVSDKKSDKTDLKALINTIVSEQLKGRQRGNEDEDSD